MSELSAYQDEPDSAAVTPARALLDVSGGCPLHPAARAALEAALERGWADPARLTHDGRQARLLLDAARAAVAEALGARPDEVFFRSSGPDALAAAAAGLAAGARTGARRWVVSEVEHRALLDAGRAAHATGADVQKVAVDRHGRVDAEQFAVAALGAAGAGPAALAALQAANHEVGTRQPVEEVADALAGAGVPLVVDLQPVLGRADVPRGWSAAAAHAPAWGGPPGVGVLAIRTGVRWRAPGGVAAEPLPVPVPLVVAAAAGLEAVARDRETEARRLWALVDEVRARVPELVADVEVVGDPVRRLPHVLTFSCLYVDGEALLVALDRRGVAVGSGSACTAEADGPSHVLAAMGVLTHGNVRLVLPVGCPDEWVHRLLDVLPDAVRAVREEAGVAGL
jgi:cysteine desulfurase